MKKTKNENKHEKMKKWKETDKENYKENDQNMKMTKKW